MPIDTCRRNRRSGSLRCCATGSCLGITRTFIFIPLILFKKNRINSQCRPSMHGTLLDQRVFEALVQRCLPIIHDHFQEVDVQLSVASLPWFLSLCVSFQAIFSDWI